MAATPFRLSCRIARRWSSEQCSGSGSYAHSRCHCRYSTRPCSHSVLQRCIAVLRGDAPRRVAAPPPLLTRTGWVQAAWTKPAAPYTCCAVGKLSVRKSACSTTQDAAALGRLLSSCSHTEVCVIPHIDRDPALKPDPIPLVHIKRQHRFDYENGLCYRSELSEAPSKSSSRSSCVDR